MLTDIKLSKAHISKITWNVDSQVDLIWWKNYVLDVLGKTTDKEAIKNLAILFPGLVNNIVSNTALNAINESERKINGKMKINLKWRNEWYY